MGESGKRMVDTGCPSRRLLTSSSTSTAGSSKSSHGPEAEEPEAWLHSSKGKGAHKAWHLFPKKHQQTESKGVHKKKGQDAIDPKYSHKWVSPSSV